MRPTITFALLLALLPAAFTQTIADKAIETLGETLGTVSLGMSEADFFKVKSTLPRPDTTAMGFRDEVVETIGKNGLSNITYYFDADGDRMLYEFIVGFSDGTVRAEAAETMFGPSNYPGRPDYWIAGAQDNIVSLIWAFDSKIVIAANLPGTEWDGDAMFTIPEGFETNKHLPLPMEWPREEMARFWVSLEQQIDAGFTQFEQIRGAESDGYYVCTLPLAAAQASSVLQDDKKKWVVSNTFISGATLENAVNWQLSMESLLEIDDMAKYHLSSTDNKEGFGGTIRMWHVKHKNSEPTGLQVGLLYYEWGAEGLWNVDVLVMQE